MKLIQFTKKALLLTTLFSCLSIASYAKNAPEEESSSSIPQLITQLESQQKDDTLPLITLASSQRRFLAFFIDSVISIILGISLAGILSLQPVHKIEISSFLIFFCIFSILFLQEIIFYKPEGGGGLGKYLLGIQAVDAKGLQLTKKKLFIRTLCKYLFFVVTWMSIPFKAHNNKQAFHDIITETHVIRKQKIKKADLLLVQQKKDQADNITSENMIIAPILSRLEALAFNVGLLLPFLGAILMKLYFEKGIKLKSTMLIMAIIAIPLLLICERCIGKRIFHIKIVDKEGNSPTLKASLIRILWKYGSCGVSFLWAFLDEHGQAFHDKQAGTYVVVTQEKVKTKGDIDNFQQMSSSTTIPKSNPNAS